jgi:small GTP-binding protein
MNDQPKPFKVVLLGDHRVGKTDFVNTYVNNALFDNKMTIGIDFKTKTVTQDGKNYRLQIWDTVGQERFESLIPTYCKGAHCILICFDINDRQTFVNACLWLGEANKNKTGSPVIALVGIKKADNQTTASGVRFVKPRAVTEFEGSQLAFQTDLTYYEIDLNKDGEKEIHDKMFEDLIFKLDVAFSDDDKSIEKIADKMNREETTEHWYNPVINYVGSFF